MNWKFWQKEKKEPVASSKSYEETMKEYLSDLKVIANLQQHARLFEKQFRGNSFTLQQVMKKSGMKSDEAFTVLNMLLLKGYAHSEVKDNLTKYKITLKAEDRLRMLEKDLEIVDSRKDALQKEIQSLKDSILEKR